MQIKIKQIDSSLPLPTYETEGSVGFDLYCRETTIIEPHTLARVPANVIIQVPEGYILFITLRSSTPKKYNLLMPHGVGVIDQDYCGDGDEILVQVYNYGVDTVTVLRGERIAQGIILPVCKVSWQETDNMQTKTRGGFGSTDKGKANEVGR